MTQELLTSGEIEQIIRRELLKGFERGIESAFKWGSLKDAIEKRITDTMVPYIEKYDMSRHLLKLDEILAELVETSAIDGHRKLLENFRTTRRDIKAFCESFNEKYAETVYFPNWSVGVVKD